jgi:arylsulfate sulfotransferase
MKTYIAIIVTAISLALSNESPSAHPTIAVTAQDPGPSPFISFVHLTISRPVALSYVTFQIDPKFGSATRALSARYSAGYLERRGYWDPRTGRVTVPVFGLYAGYNNTVKLVSRFVDGTSQADTVMIQTPVFDGGTYSNPTIIQSRLPGTTLSYDYILLKNYATPNTPIIIDSDAQVRWVGTANIGSMNSALFDNALYVAFGTQLFRIEFDGQFQILADYSSLGVTGFHHNIDYGKSGLIIDVDTNAWTESVDIEVDAAGNVLKTWNLADIISAAMIAGGDDPTKFVHPAPIDWFHNNATAYRPSDNSLIVSSRENFVISIDYDSGAIKWILGDPTKHWHQFQSLRNFALTLGPFTLPPIGQHAVSLTKTVSLGSDQLLLFDDGTNSQYQVPPGDNRDYSAPRSYSIDQQRRVATETWHYLANPPIYSPYCSSVYEDLPRNYLIDYTLGGPYIFTEIVGLDATGEKAFDYMYNEQDFCGTAFYAVPIHLENLNFK